MTQWLEGFLTGCIVMWLVMNLMLIVFWVAIDWMYPHPMGQNDGEDLGDSEEV